MSKYLSYISDQHLFDCISNLYDKYTTAKENFTQQKFYKNKIDIIKARFDQKFNDLDAENLIKAELVRQVDRTVVNAIGDFHEEILGGIQGYSRDIQSGYDIKSDDDKVFIELKNKHNTLKGEDKKSVFNKLKGLVDEYPHSIAYYARILDTKSQNEAWKFNVGNILYADPRIFIISGDELYKMMTGEDDAFFKLYEVLPQAIDDFMKLQTTQKVSTNDLHKVIDTNAKEASRDFLDQIAYDNFKYYSGFDKL